jgi:hypothetical protein
MTQKQYTMTGEEYRISVYGWDVTCRECGDELPPAFAGRPRSYCSVTCRQRAYRRRKAEATAAKATKPAPGAAQADDAPADRRHPASAEAIMIRVRLDEAGSGAPVPPGPARDWGTLDELTQAALLLARLLRAQRQEPDVEPADAAGTGQAPHADSRRARDEDASEPRREGDHAPAPRTD